MPGGGMVPVSEERTIRELVLPALQHSNWDASSWTREFPITAGRRTVASGRIRKGERLFADIALLHRPAGGSSGGHPISVVEVKRTMRDERQGESVTVRAALGRPTGEPFQPTERNLEAAQAALRGLPSHGWTQGMFGRRDRCLLVLSQLAGVPYRHLATLTAGEISIAGRDAR